MRYLPLLFVLLLCTCGRAPESELRIGKALIIPQPLEQSDGIGHFEFRAGMRIKVDQPEYADPLNGFLARLGITSGWLELNPDEGEPEILIATDPTLPAEGYTLDVTPKTITLKTATEAGLFYALITLEQLLPPDFDPTTPTEVVRLGVPAVSIRDEPRFSWRGYMLDVSRHFFSVEEVKQVIDMAAAQKMNRFHWHLTDDQGWRIEIKSRPLLTKIGAWRADRTNTDERYSDWWGRAPLQPDEEPTYGGFYTQEEISEIVAYAKARFIEIVPEIDMPGHAQAAVAAYPEIGAVNALSTVATGGVFKNNTLNPGKEETFAFAEDVLNEVMDLFPFGYVHIGGDECNKSQWTIDPEAQRRMQEEGLKSEEELQSYFIRRMEQIVNARGKTMIGWDEILEGGLAPNAVVMSWRGDAGGIAAAQAGHQVIMTPSNRCYLDLKQGHDDLEPNLGYSVLTLTEAYNNPVIPEDLKEEEAQFVLGTQANMWTESISDWGKFTYMNYPRVFAVAECAWSVPERKNWDDFIRRVGYANERLAARKIRYAVSAFSPWVHHEGVGDGIKVWFGAEVNNLDIRYTLDGSEPDTSSAIYSEPLVIRAGEELMAQSFSEGRAIGYPVSLDLPVHRAAGLRVANAGAKALPDLSDLQYARLTPVDSNWVRLGDEAELFIDFEEATEISSLRFHTLRYTISGIYPPVSVEVSAVGGEESPRVLAQVSQTDEANRQGRNKVETKLTFDPVVVSRLRVRLKSHQPVPEGHHKAGSKARIYLDELVVE